jgi:3-hydroxyisobutyrate dehydrogenase
MSMTNERKTVGFIGLGIMGTSMAGHILDGGHDLIVYNRTEAKARPLLDKGAVWAANPGDLATLSDIVITIVGYPRDVEEIYLGNGGIIDRARPGTILIDMTTSSPEVAKHIAGIAKGSGVFALDAPVSGGDVGARAGNLAIMVGGNGEAFATARPILELMGGKVMHMGPAGAGQHTKMANQIAIASTMMAVSESLAYAEAAGLDRTALIELIGTGAAGSFLLNGLGPKMVAHDYTPGFFVHHFVKDMNIALAEAERMGLDLPGLALARSLYDKLVAGGFGEDGTQALYRLYERAMGGTDAV